MPINSATSSGLFSGQRALDPLKNSRAYAGVVLIGPGGRRTLDCLVDTGSDYTILPDYLASAVGIIVPLVPTASFTTAAGTPFSLPMVLGVSLEVEGIPISVSVAFTSSTTAPPILGRREILAACDIGFNNTDWFWD